MSAQTNMAPMDRVEEEVSACPQGISILKEVFPDHPSEEAPANKTQTPLLHQLLGGIPSPVRALTSPARGVVSTTPLTGIKTVPPPPPLAPAPVCSPVQECWDMPHVAAPPLVEPGFASYRERLRAGGRGALQRALDAGLMPKSMKQDASARPEGMPMAPNAFQRQQDALCSTPMSQSSPMAYTSAVDGQPLWNTAGAMHGNDYWPSQVDHSQPPAQYPCVQQMQNLSNQVPQMGSMQHLLGHQSLAPQMPTQQHQFPPQMPSQMQQPQLQQSIPLGVGADTPVPQMQFPQMQAPEVRVNNGAPGDSTPTEWDKCMAIVMPQTAQFPCDKDLLAAQLRAAADCHCYED